MCSQRDFENGAVQSEIYESLKRMEKLEAQINRECKRHLADRLALCDAPRLMKCPYCRIFELETQVEIARELIVPYFEGCDGDTFDDLMRNLRKALEQNDE